MHMTTRSIVAAFLALLALSVFAPVALGPAATAASARDLRAHTTVTLHADVRSIQPGSRFTVGVLMKMDPGWHTYWVNPGESGLPTEIQWKLPAGFTAGTIEWPLPEKHTETGDILTFGYSGETMLLVPLTAPASLTPGTQVSLSAEVSWLECEKTCVPGKTSLTLTLPVSAAAPAADNTGLFDKYRAEIPVPARVDGITVSATPAGVLTLTAPLPDAASSSPVDFYPAVVPGVPAGRVTATREGSKVSVAIPLTVSPPADSAAPLRGVLVFTDAAGKHRAEEIALSVPPGTLKSLAAPSAPAGSPGSLFDRQFTVAAQGDQRPLLLYLAFAFVGGLLLNVMPCVLPVIALKIFGLVKMAGDQKTKVRRLGLSFSAGIVVSFLVLALLVIILQAAGQQVGWGFQFQEPLFVIIMGAVVFAFGLSLFGVFEVRLPARAVEGVGTVLQKREGGSGYGASFSEGVFATVLATPCTAPFLGTALGFAFSQPAWAILLIFATVALGMAVPYILLTARPAWMKFLPKPGQWMETAKQFMGFLMMATLVWLLYILGKQLGVEGLVWTVAFFLVIGLACWIIGRFLTLDASRARAYAVWAVALVLVMAGYVLLVAPVLREQTLVADTSGISGAAEEHGGILWEPFTAGGLEAHLRDNQPVLLDFTAEWCLTCKVNEKAVLSSKEVVDKIRSSRIVTMRADWTNRNPEITKLLAKFGRSGVPLYVLFPAGRPDEPIVLPEVITSSIVIDAVDRAVGAPTAVRTP